ncbi:MAG: 16S rRNA (guanine(966)-N(2))-methyltransferase RsmD [Candidatus Krumholzibacteriota bacterium]|nr:16S rRNA (guanine(966)-N(2))-methyltransferase RsmD [Candidatus Krumholzibacteriota bacterium]
MRVIAGECKGRALRCGRGPQFRPTSQLVKGSIFDQLGAEVAGRSVLDLFAGSGAIGIEALSRGAARAVFVEQDRAILRALRTNLERCGYGADRADVVPGDARLFLSRLASRGAGQFDVIFADPPYASAVAQEVVRVVETARRAICRLLVVESGSPVSCAKKGRLELRRSRKFGQTTVSIFDCRGGAAAEPEGGGDS